MSGSYIDANAPTISADAAEVAAGVQTALNVAAAAQAEAASFVGAHGAAVNAGHTPVNDVPPALGSA